MPVLQGRTPSDYIRCLDALEGLMLPGTVVGVGSMCRRPIHGPEGLIAVVERLSRMGGSAGVQEYPSGPGGGRARAPRERGNVASPQPGATSACNPGPLEGGCNGGATMSSILRRTVALSMAVLMVCVFTT